MQTENSASPSSGAFCVSEVRMGEVVQLRDYQHPIVDDRQQAETDLNNRRRDMLASLPPIKDTAPSEYSAPDDGDCA